MNIKRLRITSFKTNFVLRLVQFLIIFLSLQILTSCTSVTPAAREARFVSIGEVKPAWQPFSDGIKIFHGKTTSPQLEFWALQIDTTNPSLQIVVRSGAAQTNTSAQYKHLYYSTRVLSFVRDNNLLAGINAVPFDIASTKEMQPIKNMGIVVSDGVLLAPANPNYDALVFYTNDINTNGNNTIGSMAVISQAEINSIENIQNAVGGFHKMLENGQPAPRTENSEARHPRTAAGICPDSRYLYLLVIDGRRAGSVGATELEIALLLRCLGSSEGINFDGGGSTALALRFPNGKVRIANTPTHNGIPGRQRAVAACLGIFSLSTEK